MRRLRVGSALVMVVALAGCWTVPGAGPERSGHNPYETRLTVGNVASLAHDWTWQADWETAHIASDPIVTSGGVHVAVGHRLMTLDPETGAVRWGATLFEPETPTMSSGDASAADGIVFAPVSTLRDFVPGAGIRRFEVGTGASLGVLGNETTLAVPRDGRLVGTYVEVVGTGFIIAGYFVIDRHDPSRSWDAVQGTFSPAAFSSPAVGPNGFYVATEPSVHAYPLTKPAGCAPFGGTWETCPATWTQRVGDGVTRPTLTRDGTQVIVGAAGTVVGFEAATGATRWTATLPTAAAPLAPPSADDRFVFVAHAGKLVVYETGGCAGPCTPIWTADLGGEVAVQPAIAGGVVYTATSDGLIRAFAAGGCGQATCTHRWETNVGANVSGGPSISNGHLYVGTTDGRVVAFGPTT